jgi:hypothetical protein
VKRLLARLDDLIAETTVRRPRIRTCATGQSLVVGWACGSRASRRRALRSEYGEHQDRHSALTSRGCARPVLSQKARRGLESQPRRERECPAPPSGLSC